MINTSINRFITACKIMCVSLLLLSTQSCSKNCQGSMPGECSSYNNKQAACKAAECHYDEKTHLCEKKGEQAENDFCTYLAENECKASGACTYHSDTKACKEADASIKGTCAAYQLQMACNNDIKCEWIEQEIPPCRNKTAH